MNKRSVKKVRTAKASQRPALRKASARKAPARQPVRKPEAPGNTNGSANGTGNGVVNIAAVPVAEVVARAPMLRTHKYRVGQTVFYTSSPISRPGASGSYQVVRLLPSDGDDYQYRIKNPGEAFERVAKESQLELEH
jgi:hypothetical protein